MSVRCTKNRCYMFVVVCQYIAPPRRRISFICIEYMCWHPVLRTCCRLFCFEWARKEKAGCHDNNTPFMNRTLKLSPCRLSIWSRYNHRDYNASDVPNAAPPHTGNTDMVQTWCFAPILVYFGWSRQHIDKSVKSGPNVGWCPKWLQNWPRMHEEFHQAWPNRVRCRKNLKW